MEVDLEGNVIIESPIQILWVKDLRLRYLIPEGGDDNFAFEIIINKTRNRPQSSIFLSCDNEATRNNW